ncbi:MAG: guanitoxin biosynthesis heme-dependent pre-guanitoxin N-hydroxylase GntA [Pacificimonas sp.]
MSISRPVRTRIEAAFLDRIADHGFPCVGAKAAANRDEVEIYHARNLTSAWDDVALHRALLTFARRYERRSAPFMSFVAIFGGPRTLDEAKFERAMWARLQSLSDKDAWLRQPYAENVSADPVDPEFGLSFGGQGFFAVGLHPRASRKSRRFETPAIVFNLHDQFRQLREKGRYENMRESILTRDRIFCGSDNPMIARHGETSEARQYSGRRVENGWVCPFKDRRTDAHA